MRTATSFSSEVSRTRARKTSIRRRSTGATARPTEVFQFAEGQRFFATNHQYLDDNPTVTPQDSYTVTVRIVDDDGDGEAFKSTTVIVKNVAPMSTSLTPPAAGVFEGDLTAFTFAFADPGTLDVHRYQVDWGDGSPSTAVTNVAGGDRAFTDSHVYADDKPGGYTVKVTMFDDDSGQTTAEFNVLVVNVAPTILPTTDVAQIIEGDTVTVTDLGAFTDPGFDNPAAGTFESFTATIDWHDGTPVETLTGVGWTTGSPGVKTMGQLGGASHKYVDNDRDGTPDFRYNPEITLVDDDTGEVVGVFTIEVRNSTPVLKSISATDVNTKGETTLTLTFSDLGEDSHRIAIDWGDGVPDPPLELVSDKVPADVATSNPNVSIARVGEQTFVITHKYSEPPDPNNPTGDIRIFVQVWDDDVLVVDGTNTPAEVQPVQNTGFSNILDVTIGQPGIGQDAVRIDTTPKVPLLTIVERPTGEAVVGEAKTGAIVVTGAELSGAAGESIVTGERMLELCVVNPDGTEQPGIPLAAKWLNNLPGLFRHLPDNRYAIYLVQAQTNVRRKVIEVIVRNGKAIDPGDDSEGARDRPPTDESTTKPADNQQPPPDAAQPLQGARREAPQSTSSTVAAPLGAPVGAPWQQATASDVDAAAIVPSSAALRHGRVIAGAALCLSAAARPWRRQVEKALAQAKPHQWRRLRMRRHWPRRPR